MSLKALERHLLPLMPYLEAEGVTEICINRPQEIFVEADGKFIRHELDELDYIFLHSLAALVAEANHILFPATMVAGKLPTGERAQFVLPPACEVGKVVCSIRRHQRRDITLSDYERNGAFDKLLSTENHGQNSEENLRALYQQRDYLGFIKQAIKGKKNLLISGGTGTGKTTFLNACLKIVADHERLITVEDVREVMTHQQNSAHLLFNPEDGQITALNVFKACLRLRPDRIFLSELRGHEVWPYLRAANSGHPGSISTVHADSPEGAITQLIFMMQQAGSTSSEEQLKKYIQSIIHVVIQLKRDPKAGRFMYVSDVWMRD